MRDCAVAFGAVRLALFPSARTAHERISSSRLCSSMVSADAPTPSPRTYPLARASNVLHRPSVDSMPARAKRSDTCGKSVRFTAAASAALQSDERRLTIAQSRATKAEEQAVSTLAHGPCTPRAKDRRPEAIETCVPVAAYTLSLPATSAKSVFMIAT
eukprot:2696193-Prymnesium_polylepis.1